MNKQYFDDINNDYDDIDSDLEDMIRSLRFRNRHDRKSYHIYNDGFALKQKRNRNREYDADIGDF